MSRMFLPSEKRFSKRRFTETVNWPTSHIYWDQASVLKQIGLATDTSLPAFRAETAQKISRTSASRICPRQSDIHLVKLERIFFAGLGGFHRPVAIENVGDERRPFALR